MEKPLKFGIVGTNFISERFTQAVLLTECAVVSAVCSRTMQGAQTFIQKNGLQAEVFDDYDTFCRNEDIDAIYVAVPNALHKDYAIRAMEKGKSVLCEKIIACDSASLSEMRSCAKKNRVLLLEAMRPAYDPALGLIFGKLPLLGKIRYARFEFSQYSSRYDRFLSGEVLRAFNPAYGNAALMDIGVYPLHACVTLFGTPEKITGTCVKLHNGFEGLGVAYLTYPGMVAEVVWSKITQQVTPSVIVGEKGTLSFDSINSPAEIILSIRGQNPKKIPYTPHENNMIFEVEAFCQAVREGKLTHPSVKVTETVLHITDELRRQNGIVFPPLP